MTDTAYDAFKARLLAADDGKGLLAKSAHTLARAMEAYSSSGRDVHAMTKEERDILGVSAFREERLTDVRSIAIEAQARLLSASGNPRSAGTAINLRAMGPTAEAAAYGYDQTAKGVGLHGAIDRVIMEGAHVYLTAMPGADRDAAIASDLHLGGKLDLAAGRQAFDGGARDKEARAIFEKMSPKDGFEAARAAQIEFGKELMGGFGLNRWERSKLMGISNALETLEPKQTDSLRYAFTSMSAIAGWGPSKGDVAEPKIHRQHPLGVMMRMSAAVIIERDKAITAESKPKGRLEEAR